MAAHRQRGRAEALPRHRMIRVFAIRDGGRNVLVPILGLKRDGSAQGIELCLQFIPSAEAALWGPAGGKGLRVSGQRIYL